MLAGPSDLYRNRNKTNHSSIIELPASTTEASPPAHENRRPAARSPLVEPMPVASATTRRDTFNHGFNWFSRVLRSQEEPGGARGTQGETGEGRGTTGSQEEPGGTRGARRSQENQVKNSWGRLGLLLAFPWIPWSSPQLVLGLTRPQPPPKCSNVPSSH